MASFEAEPGAELRDEPSPATAESGADSRPDGQAAVVPERDGDRRDQSYQELFRAIGSMLDEDTTSTIGIVEVDDGFLVRAERFKQLLVEVSVNHVPRSDLVQRIEEMRRTRPPSGKRHHPGLWDSLPVTHQDFFRALGYELDSVGARRVVIDELSDGLLLWYEQVGDDGRFAVTRRLSLGRAEIEEILNDAVRRRRVPVDGKPSDLYLMNWGGADANRPHESSVEWILQRTDVPYQEMLRGLGRILDQRGAGRVCVLELPDGFAVRFELPHDADVSWARLADEDVLTEGPENRQKPASGGLFRRQAPVLQSPQPDGYSDLFRALGYELQRTDASDIFIAEQDDGLAVSYQYRDRQHQLTVRRTIRVLSKAEQEQLLAEAHARRRPTTGGR